MINKRLKTCNETKILNKALRNFSIFNFKNYMGKKVFEKLNRTKQNNFLLNENNLNYELEKSN